MVDHKKLKKFFLHTAVPVFLSAVVAITPSEGVYADKVSDLRQKTNETQSQLNAANDETDSLESQEEEIEAELEQKNSQLVENLASIQLLEETIADLDTRIAEKQEEYDQAKADEDARYAAMKQRIRYMYEQGDATYVQILMKATSLSDVLTKANYVEQLYAYDRKMLEEYQEVQQEVAKVQQELEEEKSEQEESKRGLEEEQDALQQTVDELTAQNVDVQSQLAEARAEAAELAAQLKQQNAELSAAVEQQAKEEEARRLAAQKAAEEAAQKAAEEAARKEAEEKAKAESQSKSTQSASTADTADTDVDTGDDTQDDSEETTVSSTYSDDNTYDADAAEEETSENSEESDSESSESESSSSSGSSGVHSSGSMGVAVANYACQFVGNPYVYGGNSLTTGTDCSGFTSLVYAHFGYSIGRTDVAQRSAGVAVASLADAEPGDIICYPGHVGIYIGNGTIVHASTAATGIKYSAATYRAYICIRRIIQ